MGAHASLWLYDRIIQLCKVHRDQDYLEIILHNNSNIPDRTQAILFNGSSPVPELRRSVNMFNEHNADVIVMACMTAYYFYPQLVSGFSGKFLHPVDFVLEELRNDPVFSARKKIGLIGSTGMLKGGVFQSKLEPLGFQIITVNEEEQEKYFMNPIYKRNGFKAGVFDDENKALFMEQFNILHDKGAEVIVGACSEVPLIIDKYNIQKTDLETPFIDAFDLLAGKIVQYCYSNK